MPPGRPDPFHRSGSQTDAGAPFDAGAGGHVDRLARLPVDQVLQFLARLEVRDALGRHVHLVAGLRVAALAGLALAKAEAAESAQLDLLAALEGIDDALEHGVDDDLGVLLREVRDARDFFDQFRLRHISARR